MASLPALHTEFLCSVQGVIAYLEFLTLRAIYEVYIGNRTFQADRVKQNFQQHQAGCKCKRPHDPAV